MNNKASTLLFFYYLKLIIVGVNEFLIFFLDMINMMKLPFSPGVCEWIYKKGDEISTIAMWEL